MQTLAQERGHLFAGRAFSAACIHHVTKRQRQAGFGEDLYDGVCGAAQREWILRSCRRIADAEHGSDGLNAVSKAEHAAFNR